MQTQPQQPDMRRNVVSIPTAVTGAISWRAPGIVYKRNDLYFDVLSKIYILYSQLGEWIDSFVIARSNN